MGHVRSESDFLEQVKEMKEFFPVILPGIYFIGFLYLRSYYGYFGINILNYINFNDLIIEGLYLLLLYISIYFSLTLFNLLSIIFLKETPIYEENLRKNPRSIKYWTFVFISAISLITYLGIRYFADQYYNVLLMISILALIKSCYNLYLDWREQRDLMQYVLVFGMGILFLSIFSFGINDARSSKIKSFDDTNISFELNGEKYTTSDSNMQMIGETRDYFFLHEVTLSQTHVFKKDDLKNIVYQKIHFDEYFHFQILNK